MAEQVVGRDRFVRGARAKPWDVLGDGRGDVDSPLFLELKQDDRRERLADRPDLEERFRFHRRLRRDIGITECADVKETLAVGEGKDESRRGVVLHLARDVGAEQANSVVNRLHGECSRSAIPTEWST